MAGLLMASRPRVATGTVMGTVMGIAGGMARGMAGGGGPAVARRAARRAAALEACRRCRAAVTVERVMWRIYHRNNACQ